MQTTKNVNGLSSRRSKNANTLIVRGEHLLLGDITLYKQT